MFGKRRKKIIQLEADLNFLKKLYEEKQVALLEQARTMQFKDNKIRELMDSNQILNRNLDLWEPLANRIAEIGLGINYQTLTIPDKGLHLLKDYESEKYQK